MQTDLIIIGAGPGGYHTAAYAARQGLSVTIIPGGYHTAAYAARQGLSVTIIEKADVGGTCLNQGCIPTKALCHDAEAIEAAKRVCGENVPVDFTRISERKRDVVEKLRNDVEMLMTQPGITLVRGNGVLTGTNTVAVGGEEYTAKNIITATGSRPKTLPIEGIGLPGVLDSTSLLATDTVPNRLCIIGAGFPTGFASSAQV